MEKKGYKHWRVYSQYFFDTEEPEDCFTEDWKFRGETWATSADKAINNVRYRVTGKTSQYKPIAVSGHWENGLNWKAELIEEDK